MKPKNLMLTTALAAILAAPVAAQENADATGGAEQGAQGDMGGYSVGDFLDLAVVTSDGSEAGQVEAVIEGGDGTRVLVNLQDKTVALPLDEFSLSQDGTEQLVIDRSMDELQEMAAFEPSGEMQFSEETQMADAMARDTGQGGDSAEMEELETTVVEDTPEDVTVITTAPEAVETEGGQEGDAQMAEGETQMDGQEGDAEMAEGETQTGLQPETDLAQGETDTTAAQDDTQMAEDGTGSTAQQGDMTVFANMTVGEILGMEVMGADGQNVGEIDYVYQGDDGYQAVIGIGGFLGLGEHTVALPLSDFSMNQEGDGLVLENRTEQDLEAMPEVDESGIESLPDDHMIEA